MEDDLKNIEFLKNSFENWEADIDPDEMNQDWIVVKSRIGMNQPFLKRIPGLKYLIFASAGIIAFGLIYLTFFARITTHEIFNYPRKVIESKNYNSQTNTGNRLSKTRSDEINVNKGNSDHSVNNQPIQQRLFKLNPGLPGKSSENINSKIIDIIKNKIVSENPGISNNSLQQTFFPHIISCTFPEIVFGHYIPLSSGKINIFDTVICLNDSLSVVNNTPGQLNIILPEENVVISSEKTSSFKFSIPGEYFIQIKYSEQGKEAWKTLRILVISKPNATFVINDNQSPDIKFLNQTLKTNHFTWFFGDNSSSTLENPVHKYLDTGYFKVTLIAIAGNGCNDTATKTFYVFADPEIEAPNVFTPNNDGINDKYKIKIKGDIYFHLSIYNSDGQIVFSSNDKNDGWDGSYRGKECQNGIYYFVLKYQMLGQTSNRIQKGTITLLK